MSPQRAGGVQCPVGAAFAFGGKLVRFGPGSHVRIQKVHTDHTLSGRARTLLETLQRGSLQDFVINKVKLLPSPWGGGVSVLEPLTLVPGGFSWLVQMVENEDNAEEKMIWRFMNLLLEDRSDQQVSTVTDLGCLPRPLLLLFLLLTRAFSPQACRDELFQTLGLDTAEMTATLKRVSCAYHSV